MNLTTTQIADKVKNLHDEQMKTLTSDDFNEELYNDLQDRIDYWHSQLDGLATQTLTFNKANWSGDEMTLRVTEDGWFHMFGYLFHVIIDDAEGTLSVESNGWSHPIAGGGQFKDGSWSVWGEFGGLSREDTNPFVATAQLLSNII